jgi:hypothetical protein
MGVRMMILRTNSPGWAQLAPGYFRVRRIVPAVAYLKIDM